ncbi:hypothetical protein T459_25606 [Capsicum annuum]|uniref:PLAT domain-containing protein n=1 Tax=Capsicum annuum TaxID=4072 RepID=A0A2G2YL74_CAPAN|nr:hypothetical protein T459_25606 [Capsicum annuum]
MKIHSPRMSEFHHMSLTVAADDPSRGSVHFDCNSWVSPADNYDYHRILFVNQHLWQLVQQKMIEISKGHAMLLWDMLEITTDGIHAPP